MKNIVKYILTFVIIVVVLFALLGISALIPSNVMKENVKESAITMLLEGAPKNIYLTTAGAEISFDNQSDALMINTAYSIDNRKPIYSVLTAKKNYIPDSNQIVYKDQAKELKSASKYNSHDELRELLDVVSGEVNESFEYARYWHGYLSILRPLLCIFNLEQMRTVFSILLNIAILAFLIIIWNKKDLYTAIILALGFICTEIIYMGISMQGVWVQLIAVITSIIIAIMRNKIKDFKYIFFITGIITNYFDLLTVPLLTLGMPLLTYFITSKEPQKIIESIKTIAVCSIFWGIGYAAMWASKWIIFDLLYGRDLIKVAIEQIGYRSVGGEFMLPYEDILKLNFKIVERDIITILIPSIFILIMKSITYRKEIKDIKSTIKLALKRILPYLIISIMPIVWYFVLKDHSMRHAFFTYRNLFLTFMGIALAIIMSIDYQKVSKKGAKETTQELKE